VFQWRLVFDTAEPETDPSPIETTEINVLQAVLATAIVCVLRYAMHAVTAAGISSEGIKKEFAQHAEEERQHMLSVAERINQLGGKPDFNPEGLASRAMSQYAEGENLVDMIRENLIVERIAVDHYRELIRYFGDDDPGTRVMLEGILTKEEEHANDMQDLLDAHQGSAVEQVKVRHIASRRFCRTVACFGARSRAEATSRARASENAVMFNILQSEVQS
jgi:bacterioferritin